MSEPFVGELRIFSFSFAPKGWAFCNGQILSISQYQALFSLLGTTYGGNGSQTFALPNLQGRVPTHFGAGIAQGSIFGTESHTLTQAEIPAHSHPVFGTGAVRDTTAPGGTFLANGSVFYASAPGNIVPLSSTTVSATGGGQAHENRQPFLVLNVCIALNGIFPSRN
jgi:microcystin-dependent protein